MIARNKERVTITIEKKVLFYIKKQSTELECTVSEYINDIIKKEMNFNGKKAI